MKVSKVSDILSMKKIMVIVMFSSVSLIYAEDKNSSSFLHKIGIYEDGNKIIIDTNRTKNYLQSLSNSFEKETKELKKELKEHEKSINSGIDVSDEKIVVDINKSKKYLKGLIDILQKHTKELSKSLEEIE